MLPDDDIRGKIRENLKDQDSKFSATKYILMIFLAAIVVPIIIQIPDSLIGTQYEWIVQEIKNSNFWKIIYGLTFCVVFVIISGVIISIYEFLKERF